MPLYRTQMVPPYPPIALQLIPPKSIAPLSMVVVEPHGS
jgi:hypothetical protein